MTHETRAIAAFERTMIVVQSVGGWSSTRRKAPRREQHPPLSVSAASLLPALVRQREMSEIIPSKFGRVLSTLEFPDEVLQMKARVSVSVLLIVSFAACAKPIILRPEPAPVLPPVPLTSSFDRTWDASVSWFAERNIPITTIEKASGVIMAELKNGLLPNRSSTAAKTKEASAKQSPPLYADCGTRDGVGYDPTGVIYNIRVTGDARKSTAQVNAKYTQDGSGVGNSFFVCSSTGKWESDVQAFIKSRAEGAK